VSIRTFCPTPFCSDTTSPSANRFTPNYPFPFLLGETTLSDIVDCMRRGLMRGVWAINCLEGDCVFEPNC